MATDKNSVKYVVEQLERGVSGVVSAKKMFGEYGVYVDGRMVLCVCDNMVYVKIAPETQNALGDENPTARPYPGAKPCFLLDPDDGDRMCIAVNALLDWQMPNSKH